MTLYLMLMKIHHVSIMTRVVTIIAGMTEMITKKKKNTSRIEEQTFTTPSFISKQATLTSLIKKA